MIAAWIPGMPCFARSWPSVAVRAAESSGVRTGGEPAGGQKLGDGDGEGDAVGEGEGVADGMAEGIAAAGIEPDAAPVAETARTAMSRRPTAARRGRSTRGL